MWYQIPLGIMQTNCYIIENSDGDCLIFDPGGEGKKLISWLMEKKLNPIAIFLTHAHFDHIGAVDEVRDYYQIPVYAHKNEKDWLPNPMLNGSQLFGMAIPVSARSAEHLLTEEKQLSFSDFEITIFKTPGHSPGSVSYFFKTHGIVIAGDTLFRGSIGRTDLLGGNQEQLLKSIHDKLLTLPEETMVLPGHGATTTIIEEMDSNPFINGFL